MSCKKWLGLAWSVPTVVTPLVIARRQKDSKCRRKIIMQCHLDARRTLVMQVNCIGVVQRLYHTKLKIYFKGS